LDPNYGLCEKDKTRKNWRFNKYSFLDYRMGFEEWAVFRIALKGIVPLGISASWKISKDTDNSGETIYYIHTSVTFCGSEGSQELTSVTE
jgi:hypothetical protein